MLSIEDGILKLDVDRKRAPSLRRLRFLLGRAGYTLLALIKRRSPSGSGWHLWLQVEPCPQHPAEVVALQAVLGSDPAREAVTLYRGMRLSATPFFAHSWWNVLYEPDVARSRHLTLNRGERR